jgi:hypothetical protein
VFFQCISDVSSYNSKYFHTYITLSSFIKSLIWSTTRSHWTPQIRNILCKHMYMFAHSLLLITYWPEDGQSQPKHVVIIELINYVTQTDVFWRTYPPSYVITFLLYTHVSFSLMAGSAAWNYFPKFCHCIIILMWMLSGDSKWGPFREIFICDFKLPQWCKWDLCSYGDMKICMRPKQVSMVNVLMLEFVHIPANFGN